MADTDRNRFEFPVEVPVESNWDAFLTNIEKGVNKFIKTMDRFRKKSMKPLQEAADSTEDWNRETVKAGRLAKFLGSSREKLISTLRDENYELKSATHNWRTLGGLFAGATVVGTITAMVKEYLDLTNAVIDLNAVTSDSRGLKISSEYMQGFARELGYSREELQSLMKVGLDLNVLSQENSKGFRLWADASINLAKATDMSVDSTGHFLHNLQHLYRLGPNQLRAFGNAFTYVTQTSAISADELKSFVDQLAPLYKMLPGMSEKMKGKLTQDFMAIAGVLSENGIEAGKFADSMSRMAHEFEGGELRAVWGQILGKNQRTIFDQIKSGGGPKLIKELAVAVSKFDDSGMQRFYETYKDTLGLSLDELYQIRKLGKENGKDFDTYERKMLEKMKDEKYAQKVAESRLNSFTKSFNRVKLAFENVFILLGDKIAKLIEGPLQKLANKMADWVSWLASPEGQAKITGFFNKVSTVIGWLVDKVSALAAAWNSLSSGTQKWILIGGGLLLISRQIAGVLSLAGSGVNVLLEGLKAAGGMAGGLGGSLGGILGGAAGVAGAGFAGYQVGSYLDKTFGISDKISDSLVSGQRKAAASRVNEFASSSLVRSAVDMANNLSSVAKTTGFINDGGKRSSITQDLVKDKIGQFLEKSNASSADKRAAMAAIEPILQSLPRIASATLERAAAPVSQSTPSPVVNVSSGRDLVVGVDQMLGVLVQIRDSLNSPVGARPNPSHVLVQTALGR